MEARARRPAPAEAGRDLGAGHRLGLAELARDVVEDDRGVAPDHPGGDAALRPAQLDENLGALDGPGFTTEELEQIDALSDGIDVDLWARSATS